ncbi:MAG: LapA family protein [Syntrophaceticus schinkii]|nr:LapA family protein [Syntrophaceticus schinkii]MDD4260688.1 LapA family protein [Syntrophaceticus schinkii]MDD4674367.1 LapA family protein [Syntrophaceticus schinkii]
MPLLYIMGILIFAILVAIFAVQNAGPVAIKFFFWAVPEIPLVLVIFGTVLCGIVIGFLLGLYSSRKKSSGTLRLPKSKNIEKPST